MPTPATMRVVQIEPGPWPTLMESAPQSARNSTPAALLTLPAAVATPLAVEAFVRAANSFPGPPEPQARPALLRLLAWKLIDYSRPFGQFGNKKFGRVLHERDFDLLQSALLRQGLAPQPLQLEIQFQREIPSDATTVDVRLESRETEATAFSISNQTTSFAQGLVS